MKWEPFAGYNLGRTIRSWVRPVHTGEAGGFIGQFIAALASAGGAVLVCTGLAWHGGAFGNLSDVIGGLAAPRLMKNAISRRVRRPEADRHAGPFTVEVPMT